MKKVLISLLAVVVLVTGIYFVFNHTPPKPTITIENNTVEVAQGSYCWGGLIKGQCVDMISPPELIKHHELKPVAVSPGAELKIKFNRKPQENTLVASIWFSNDEVENVPLNDDVILVPKEKGVYIYSVSARWEKGSSSYVFVIEVK
ncbi:hypothetical protein QTL97_17065 [Sporosarcina thermotolerans]|uniref:Uncharacterized protein n=1 Tax=Sporosarcina thermotolerans TaxID=633404 RepID=A0AAW9AHF3_9BACL|nr:hypothetical protein [Sporosarcina thermotolerans]MDW0118638.1 hypothetical protein [Sporosarcina thermotolerans]WHT49569.1 hypothetical protein QNH10_08705 [Sporosarcina thermotolerans]